MTQRPVPCTSSDAEILFGEEIQVDIKVFADNFKSRIHKRTFGNHTRKMKNYFVHINLSKCNSKKFGLKTVPDL